MYNSLLTTQNVSFKASPIHQKILEKELTDNKIQSKSVAKIEQSRRSNPKHSNISVQKRTAYL